MRGRHRRAGRPRPPETGEADSAAAAPARAPDPTGRAGRLSIVSTPIGNLGDLSPRARAVLEQADRVACEDTRLTGLLLHRLGIDRPLVSLHEHNERRRIPDLLARLAEGDAIALVSDAGTPLLSDPGFVLVREAAAAGHRIEPIPGPSAILAALVASGLPPYPFTFAGFAPPKPGRRRAFFGRLADLGHTVIVFESPHRLARSLADAVAAFGAERPAVLARELTKLHEEVLRGRLGDLERRIASSPGLKGEFVLVVAGDAGSADAVPDPEAAADEGAASGPPD